jgi:hypothetical protein
MQEFFGKVDQIKRNMDKIKKNMMTLEKKHGPLLALLSSDTVWTRGVALRRTTPHLSDAPSCSNRVRAHGRLVGKIEQRAGMAATKLAATNSHPSHPSP